MLRVRSRQVSVVIVAALALDLLALRWPSEPVVGRVSHGTFGPAVVVAQVTGPGSPNRTDRYGVDGTDLGSFVEGEDGRLHMAFGDTFGRWHLPRRVNRTWRSNTLARVDEVSRDGIRLAGMVTGEDDRAKQLVPSRKRRGVEHTVIPTGGIEVDGRLYLHTMSVRKFGRPGHWQTNHAELVWSDDDGHSWVTGDGPRWAGNGPFVQVAFVRASGHVYLVGIPAGRWGGVHLARVRPDRLQDATAYRYWDGSGWQPDPDRAVPVIPAPVGELSVRWNEHLDGWLFATLDAQRGEIVFRTASELTGPWSDPWTVASGADLPDPYGPFLVPGLSEGREVHFVLSLFGPYNVYLVRARLPDPSEISR